MRESPRRWGTRIWSLLLQAAVAVALLAALLFQVSPAQVFVTLASAAPSWLLLGLGLFVLADVLRALRFAVLLTVPIPARRLLPVVIVQGLANVILPARLGELSYLYLLRSRDQVSVSDSLPSLVLARLADVWALLLLLLLAVAFAPASTPPIVVPLAAIVGVLVGGASGFVLVLAWHREGTSRRMARLLAPWLDHHGWLQRIHGRVDDALRGLKVARSPRAVMVAFVFSLSIWLLASLVPYCLFRAVGVSLPLAQVLYAAVLVQFFAFVPVHVLGGLGTLNVSWAGFLVLFGLSQERAIVSALATHSVFYVFIGLEGLGAILALLWMRPRGADWADTQGGKSE